MKKLKLLTLTAFFILPVASTHAEVNEYNVEIVIFEDTSSRYINSEQWPIIHHDDNNLSAETGITELAGSPEDNQDQYHNINNVINITESTGTKLAAHVSKLEKSSRYNVLLYKSWQQAGLDNENAFDIKIDSTKTETNNDKKRMPIQANPTIMADTDTIKESNVTGTIKLILGRYLHIHTDLLYNRFNKNFNPVSPDLHDNMFNEFEIKSQRRMRSNELHYIDHPLLGMLVLISPAKETNTTNSIQDQ